MSAPAWLTARPIAHRGVHDAAKGLAENSIGAAEAAIAGGFAIECDVQLSRDGEAMVFHDDNLRRLTRARGALAEGASPNCRPSRCATAASAFRPCRSSLPASVRARR